MAAAVEPRHTFVRSVGHQEDTQRWHEVGFSVVEDGQPASGIVDLLYRVGGTWKIAEFKADEPRPGADLGAHIQREGYDAQVRRYARAVGQQLEVALEADLSGGAYSPRMIYSGSDD